MAITPPIEGMSGEPCANAARGALAGVAGADTVLSQIIRMPETRRGAKAPLHKR